MRNSTSNFLPRVVRLRVIITLLHALVDSARSYKGHFDKKMKMSRIRHYLFISYYHAGEEAMYFLCQLPSGLLEPRCDYPWESVPCKDLPSVATRSYNKEPNYSKDCMQRNSG